MTFSSKTFAESLILGSLLLFPQVGCAPIVPQELVDARAAYQRAAEGPAATLAPAEVHKAKESLGVAEQAFEVDSGSDKVRDFAYVAIRKAQLAQSIADQRQAQAQKTSADRQYMARLGQQRKLTEAQLRATRGELSQERTAREVAEQKAIDADQQAKIAREQLARMGELKEDSRGLVLTLSGSVLFASNQATLLPEAQTRLNQVAEALLASKERHLVIEGHTDSRGSDSLNRNLSQRRADSVRAYLVSRGYDGDLVRSVGFASDRPVASNSNAEGRANNRRVEIVIEPKKGGE